MQNNSQGNSYGDHSERIGLFSEDIAVFGLVPFVFFMPEVSK